MLKDPPKPYKGFYFENNKQNKEFLESNGYTPYSSATYTCGFLRIDSSENKKVFGKITGANYPSGIRFYKMYSTSKVKPLDIYKRIRNGT